MTYHDQASNAFEALEDPGKGKCPGGMTLAVARETYEYGVKNTMDNESIRGLDGQFKLTQTKKIGHYIRFAGNVLLWGKSVIRIEIHFLKSKCFQGRFSSQDADMWVSYCC